MARHISLLPYAMLDTFSPLRYAFILLRYHNVITRHIAIQRYFYYADAT